MGWFVALATDRQEHSYGGGGVHSRVQHWMQSHWHMHVSKAASAVAVGVPIGNVMGLHCLLQSQATVTLHIEKRVKDTSSNNGNAEAASLQPSSAPTIDGGHAAGDMYAFIIIPITFRTAFVALSVTPPHVHITYVLVDLSPGTCCACVHGHTSAAGAQAALCSFFAHVRRNSGDHQSSPRPF